MSKLNSFSLDPDQARLFAKTNKVFFFEMLAVTGKDLELIDLCQCWELSRSKPVPMYISTMIDVYLT